MVGLAADSVPNAPSLLKGQRLPVAQAALHSRQASAGAIVPHVGGAAPARPLPAQAASPTAALEAGTADLC